MRIIVGIFLVIVFVSIAQAQESDRVDCYVSEPEAIGMKCPAADAFLSRFPIWLFKENFRGNAFPHGLKFGDRLSCEREKDGRIDDCIRTN